MATSNNVVRAGLTPKFKDVDVLCEMLSYDDSPPKTVPARSLAPGVARYLTPAPEFLVDRVALIAGERTTLPPSPSVSILILLQGAGVLEEVDGDGAPVDGEGGQMTPPRAQHHVSQGAIYMACANTTLRIVAGAPELLLFRATARYEL